MGLLLKPLSEEKSMKSTKSPKFNNRRAFLADVGQGMLAVGLGAALANDLGFSAA